MSGIYIHIPFCERKCFYCDFYSVDNLNLVRDFNSALSKEIELRSKINNIGKISTIYFGGGTPSVLDPKLLENYINLLSEKFELLPDTEITIECNPNSVNKEKLEYYKSIGINRISLGVQSFIDEELIFLRRLHNSDGAKRAIDDIYSAGFSNLSIDLIFALPESDIHSLEFNLEEAMKFHPKHISAYSLIYEDSTPLNMALMDGEIKKIDEGTESEMYLFVMEYLKKNGYNHYEVSNYALPGFESKHNSKYWDHSEYIGLGPSAHSFIESRRLWNYPDIRKYNHMLSSGLLPVENEELIDDDILLEEVLFLGLRSKGIDLSYIQERFDIDFLKKKENIIQVLSDENFITIDNSMIRLTNKGFLVCDEICAKLI